MPINQHLLRPVRVPRKLLPNQPLEVHERFRGRVQPLLLALANESRFKQNRATINYPQAAS